MSSGWWLENKTFQVFAQATWKVFSFDEDRSATHTLLLGEADPSCGRIRYRKGVFVNLCNFSRLRL